jgi:hypothetical protein
MLELKRQEKDKEDNGSYLIITQAPNHQAKKIRSHAELIILMI